MMGIEAIRALNQQAAIEAAELQVVPLIPFSVDDVDDWPPFPFPNCGDFVPHGWEITEAGWFVDATGVGQSWESALTVEQFKTELRKYISANPGHGFAITDEGPFQVVVSAFRRTARN